MKTYLLIFLLMFFLVGCEKLDEKLSDERSLETAYSDEELLEIAHNRTYQYPEGFYKDPASLEDNIYYVNTVSISPINQRDQWIELSTNDKNEALTWVNLTMINSSDRVSISLIEENETEKYFEFKCIHRYIESLYSYTVLFRIHKTSYYHSIFNRSAPWNHAYETQYGYYNAAIEKSKVKECIEYLWTINAFSNYGEKVLSSNVKETKDNFEIHICSLAICYGDWGLRDVISLYDNYIRFNKESRWITFERSLQKEILGQQR